jgi:hypothetical protein
VREQSREGWRGKGEVSKRDREGRREQDEVQGKKLNN